MSKPTFACSSFVTFKLVKPTQQNVYISFSTYRNETTYFDVHVLKTGLSDV